ncbi:hypothetical protein J6590_013507 [Homalodisca vitripennis]|nr:hypothetical protein J6590_013507 [Homalodisca vitripennis]
MDIPTLHQRTPETTEHARLKHVQTTKDSLHDSRELTFLLVQRLKSGAVTDLTTKIRLKKSKTSLLDVCFFDYQTRLKKDSLHRVDIIPRLQNIE